MRRRPEGKPAEGAAAADGKDAPKGDAAKSEAASAAAPAAPAVAAPAPAPAPTTPTKGGNDAPSARPVATRVKKYLIAGLLVWLPLAVTIWVLQAVLGMLNGVFVWLLAMSQVVLPEGSHAFIAMLQKIPFLGVFVMVIGLLLTGVFATNVAGQWSLRQGHRLLSRIPIVKSIYSSVQQVSDTLFSSSGNAFREAVLVQYPRAGCWTIAFVTGKPGGEAALHLRGDYLSVYVPTTPNPTSGFFLMLPRGDVIALAMSVDEALKYVISMGVVAPPTRSIRRRWRCEICRAERPARAQPAATRSRPPRGRATPTRLHGVM